jgi:hypothetical protein
MNHSFVSAKISGVQLACDEKVQNCTLRILSIYHKNALISIKWQRVLETAEPQRTFRPCMEHSLSTKSYSCQINKEIACLLRNRNVHCRARNKASIDPILSLINLVHTIKPSSSKIRYYIILPSMSKFFK